MPNLLSEKPTDPGSHEPSSGDPLRRAASAAPSSAPAWGLSAGLILVSAFLFYWLRTPLDQHWAQLQRSEAETPAPTAPAEKPAPKDGLEGPTEPIWTFEDMESALQPLPDSTSALILAGREEILSFADLGSDNEARRLRARSQWENWGRIWRNRVRAIRNQMPPLEDCVPHAALEPICSTLNSTFQHLVQVPTSTTLEEAELHLNRANEVLFPPPEPEEESGGDRDPTLLDEKLQR